MKNNYIPEVLKEKISKTIYFIYGTSLILASIFSALALFTFSINDNSFLTNTSNQSQNFLGDLGSYYASFLFYTFWNFCLLNHYIFLFIRFLSSLTETRDICL